MNVKKSTWDQFTDEYSLQKTLRFSLKPIGKTLEHIQEKGLIAEDEQREKDFQKVKLILNDYYKDFIEKSLTNLKIDSKLLGDYKRVYDELKKDTGNDKLKKEFGKVQDKMRINLHGQFKKTDGFSNLFKKEIIQKDLPAWLSERKRTDDLELVNKFNKWTTYFGGFFENRKNTFTSKGIHTSIFFRIVHDNLPKFIDDIERFEKIHDIKGIDLTGLEKNFEEELSGKSLSDYFKLENFNSCLNQSGIDTFNTIIGGKSLSETKKFKGLNQLINEFSQKQTETRDKRSIRRLKLVPLYKQILSDRVSASFVLEKFSSDSDVMDTIIAYYENLIENRTTLESLLSKLNENDLNRVYLNSASLSDISKTLFDDWQIIDLALEKYAQSELGLTEKKAITWRKKQKNVSIAVVETGLKLLEKSGYSDLPLTEHTICDYFSKIEKKGLALFDLIAQTHNQFAELEIVENKPLFSKKREKDVEVIKTFLDSLMELFRFIKPLSVVLTRKDSDKLQDAYELDTDFYSVFDGMFAELREIIPLYNKVRNYVTQKPFSTKKFKLNFENSTLANGWDENKLGSNYTVLLRKNGSYFLGIMSPACNKNTFRKDELPEADSTEAYDVIRYKLLPGPNKMLPKVFFSDKNISYFNPSEKILQIRNHSSHTKNGTPQQGFDKKEFNLNDCHEFIDFLKESLNKHEEWSEFNFRFKPTEDYADISEFYRDVANQGYKLEFLKLNRSYVNKLVDNGELYLFQIWNKDFSKYSKGRKNLHTIYWENLFSEDNLKDVVYKLNGEAELFYRKASMKPVVTHPKNVEIENRNPIDGKKKSKFAYDLIKNRRYTKDKFFFHCPITLNFKARGNGKDLHKQVNRHIAKTKDEIFVLGIDRGERHLLYYSLVDSKGNIVAQDTLNKPVDDLSRECDYLDRLNKLEVQRDQARKNWNKIENIKELKSGYLSQVVHKLSKMAIENNAIIVLEDLNFGFKRGRFHIEKQVYQKFEKALIDKFNYLIFKERQKESFGGSLRAYQLTNKFESFSKLGKQSGILFYLPAAFTSKICPRTGFINMLWPKYENVTKAKEFFSKFEDIRFNPDENMFEFTFKYSKFKRASDTNKTKLEKDEWTIHSNGARLRHFKNKDLNYNWDTEEVNLTDSLKELFDEYELDYKSGYNLVDAISKREDAGFFRELTNRLKLILQLRNSDEKQDYIISCVKDKNGEFFDSRKAKEGEPKDGDANGAYHIAVKGLMAIERIKTAKEGEKPDLKIDRNSFVNYIVKMREG